MVFAAGIVTVKAFCSILHSLDFYMSAPTNEENITSHKSSVRELLDRANLLDKWVISPYRSTVKQTIQEAFEVGLREYVAIGRADKRSEEG